ncbi:retron St85 family RNA-directed DNA polymerase [Sphingomonas carotinifaciens]|uniref:retron St85 family RNA-directed DNA polymerase n=1 Tax=Sphingomonas carotinifaciens TaxID=1166323 RepID=UPI0039A120F4
MQLLPILLAETGLSEQDLNRIARTAPRRYKVYEIPKRSGGTREIAQPARELKMLQRIIVSSVLARLPVHDAAKAYRLGTSIRDNAVAHAGGTPILKMDFENFFPSIQSTDWLAYCQSSRVLGVEDAALAAQLLFRRAKGERLLKLSIGAPSSPALSNALLYGFDTIVEAEAEKRGIRYTRYADDMTFSGQRIGMLKDMVEVVAAATRTIKTPRLHINSAKTTFVTMSNRRTVTGVTLSNDGKIGLGHDRKRLINAKVHRALNGKLSNDELANLAGELAFVNVAEPIFMDKLIGKYGSQIISAIKKSVRAT